MGADLFLSSLSFPFHHKIPNSTTSHTHSPSSCFSHRSAELQNLRLPLLLVKMPSKSGSSSYTPYTITGSGTNSQGNSYDTRSQLSGDAYHYSNTNGSYYYSNGNGSTYYNSGSGSSTYTAPDGNTYKK